MDLPQKRPFKRPRDVFTYTSFPYGCDSIMTAGRKIPVGMTAIAAMPNGIPCTEGFDDFRATFVNNPILVPAGKSPNFSHCLVRHITNRIKHCGLSFAQHKNVLHSVAVPRLPRSRCMGVYDEGVNVEPKVLKVQSLTEGSQSLGTILDLVCHMPADHTTLTNDSPQMVGYCLEIPRVSSKLSHVVPRWTCHDQGDGPIGQSFQTNDGIATNQLVHILSSWELVREK
jgi:hypothetical protein